MTEKPLPSVDIVYTHFPHYRQPVFDALSRSDRFHFTFQYDGAGIEGTIASGQSVHGDHNQIKTRSLGPLLWQTGAVSLALHSKGGAFVFLGNPYIVSTWIAALILRARGIATFFWTHGWVRDEGGWKDWLRTTFYRLADGLMLYGARAKDLGIARGFSPKTLHVIGNSLDYDEQSKVRDRLLADPDTLAAMDPQNPFLLIVSRLVSSAGIDQAIEAMAEIEGSVSLVIIGEGPQRAELERLAQTKNVDAHFLGAMYAEEELAPYFLNCAAVVSPGKVGLLAMHALAYGATIVTHRDLDRQMPEFEALEEGVTGAFFNYGDIPQLSATIQMIIAERSDEDMAAQTQRRASAIAKIESDYTPQRQVELIHAALMAHQVGADG